MKSNIVTINGSPQYPTISLFSGAMGLDLGLMAAGVNVCVSQDMDKWCAETIRANGHTVVEGDIKKLIENDPSCKFLLQAGKVAKKDLFAVVGGPPCQAYSTAGKRLGVEDERGGLFEQFAQVVENLRPRFFVMENVKGLLSMHSNKDDKSKPMLLEIILKRLTDLGYHVVYGLLDAVHYGVPQFRERLIIIGSRDNEPIFIPSPTHFHLHQDPDMRWRTLGSAISDLMGNPGPGAKFSQKTIDFLKKIPEGGNWRSLTPSDQKVAMGGAFESGGGKVGFFRRLSLSQPSPTLVTSPTQKATLLGHPIHYRPLSVREYARIQQFPDSWIITGKVADCYKQIGNAVPVGLGKAIGQMLVSVAQGDSEVKVRRHRGTSVHLRYAIAGNNIIREESYDD